MWKYKFVFICILNIAPPANCPPFRHKRKELNGEISDIFKKRKEYEKTLVTDYTTTTAYKVWTELTKEKELEFCENYIGTYSTQIHRSVISANSRIVELHFKEIKDNKEQEFGAVLVTILQCGVSPKFNYRRHMNFMRSPTVDCLYILNQMSTSVVKFYIAGEVCLSGKYNFLKICEANKYEANRERKRRNYRCIDDGVGERRQYEMNHFKDFTLKPEKHKQWPELTGDDLNKFCHILVGHFSPRDIFLRIGKVHTVQIYYKEIRDTVYKVPPTVDVGALVCEIPGKKFSKNYNFIRAAKSNCVYFVKRMNPKRTKPTCYIAKQFCGAQILRNVCKTADFQVFENRDMDFQYCREFSKFLNEDVHYEETEILPLDQNQNEMEWQCSPGDVREEAVASQIGTGNCTPANMMEPKLVMNRSFRQYKRAMYERNHMKNYINAPDKYQQWPELMKENEMEICKKYVEVLFSYNPRSVLSTNTRHIWLQYQEIEDNDEKIQSASIMLALLCQISPTIGRRKFIYFVKSPNPNCLYLSNPIKSNSNRLYIITEICLNGDCDMPHNIIQRKLTYERKHSRVYDDEPLERQKYECNHIKDHQLKTTDYEKWPLKKKEDMEKLCRTLLNQLFPKNKYTEFKGDDHLIKLIYIEISDKDSEELTSLKLGALRCQMPQKKQKNIYKFIRSPRPNCVYLIKKVTPSGYFYYISKQICENQLLHTRSERTEGSDVEVGVLSVNHSPNSSFDEGSKSENEIFMGLDDIEDL